MSGPLDGVRVLDLGSPIGTWCTRLLADLGADVVLVEPPEGDPYRRQGPYRSGAEGPEASLSFAYYQAGKRSITLDLAAGEDMEALRKLGGASDVIVISPGPTRPVPGFDSAERALEWAPNDAIVCSITPFGVGGPYAEHPATHLTSFAQGGQMCRIGLPDTPPRSLPPNLHFHLASAHAAIAVVAALDVRHRVGGQFIDMSAQEVEVFHDLQYEAYHVQGVRPGGRNIGIGTPPSGVWQCRDGMFDIAAHQEQHWEAFLEMLDHPEELAEPTLADMGLRRQIFDGVSALIEPLLADQSRYELFDKGQRVGLPVCLLNTPSQFVADEQFEARDFWTDLGRPETGPLRAPGPPNRTTPELFVRPRPAPLLGEHTDEIRQEPLGEPRAPDHDGSTSESPLEGVRVLSLGAFVAGNTVAQILASLGAEVVKIESRSRPEVLRTAGFNEARTLAAEPSGVTQTPMYASLSKGTLSVSIEMGEPAGRDLFRRLASNCDVVVENYSAKVMRRWGCSYDDLRPLNERLIMASLSGYGRTGPRADYLAYASNIANFTGLGEVWWTSGTYTDFVTATHAALSVLAARRHLQETGEGVYVDASQIEAFAAMAASLYLDPLVNDAPTSWELNSSENALLTHVVRCAGEDRWAALEAETLDQWNAICTVVERSDLAAHSVDEAIANSGSLIEAVDHWAASRTPRTVGHLLSMAGVPAAAVANNEEIYDDPQLHHRRFGWFGHHRALGWYSTPRSPLRLSKTPGRFEHWDTRLGEHTADVLQRWGGLEADAVDELIRAGTAFQAT